MSTCACFYFVNHPLSIKKNTTAAVPSRSESCPTVQGQQVQGAFDTAGRIRARGQNLDGPQPLPAAGAGFLPARSQNLSTGAGRADGTDGRDGRRNDGGQNQGQLVRTAAGRGRTRAGDDAGTECELASAARECSSSPEADTFQHHSGGQADPV